ncbi:MAG: aconitate hydratase, partial [Treponema sp.]|nr:aconitate hydratase [Treponema sp.]
NLINYGIIPMTFKNPGDYDKISGGDTIEIKNIDESLKNGTDFVLVLHSKDGDYTFNAVNDLAKRSADILLQGGLASYTRNGGQ